MSTFNTSISANADDGTIYDSLLENTGTELICDNAITASTDIYLRFLNVTIPQGATISAATISMIGSSSAGTITVSFYCSQEDSAAALSVGEATGARSWGTVGANTWAIPALSAGTTYTSPDIAAVIQAIINRGGWASGNNLLVRVARSGSGAKGSNRKFRSLDHGSTPNAAQIDITYTSTTTTGQTQLGKARITVTVGRTQLGKSRVQVVTDRLQLGRARVTTTTTRDQLGRSRVTITTPQTVAGLSRVEVATGRTQLGKARVEAVASRGQTGLARVGVTAAQTQLGKSRVQIATPQTISGRSRVELSMARTQAGLSRVEASVPRAQTGRANVRNYTDRDILGKGRIRYPEETRTKTQTGIARVGKTSSTRITGQSRITRVFTATLPIVATGSMYAFATAIKHGVMAVTASASMVARGAFAGVWQATAGCTVGMVGTVVRTGIVHVEPAATLGLISVATRNGVLALGGASVMVAQLTTDPHAGMVATATLTMSGYIEKQGHLVILPYCDFNAVGTVERTCVAAITAGATMAMTGYKHFRGVMAATGAAEVYLRAFDGYKIGRLQITPSAILTLGNACQYRGILEIEASATVGLASSRILGGKLSIIALATSRMVSTGGTSVGDDPYDVAWFLLQQQ